VTPFRVDIRGASAAQAPGLVRLVEKILAAEGFHDGEICVTIVDDEVMTGLNREYTGRDNVTDVLAFSLREGDGGQHSHGHLGDVVVCASEARRQAADLALDPDEELSRLVVHGVLHLLGYDHADDVGQQRMESLQETYVKRR
jgi:probable rRNA maturation factor